MGKKIAYTTDIHLDENFPIEQGIDARKNWKIILNDISLRGIDEIIFGGDIGEIKSNKWFFESLNGFNHFITLGNHDYYNEVVKHYHRSLDNMQSELYYSQDRDHNKCIFLDSSSEVISPKQFDWFKNEINTTRNIVLFIHHPVLAVDAEVDKQFPLKERDKIKTELLNIENDVIIFCGHYHFEDHKTERNITQYITPAGSYQVEKIPNEIKVTNNTFGYRIVEFDKEEITTELVMFTNSCQ